MTKLLDVGNKKHAHTHTQIIGQYERERERECDKFES